MKLKALHIVLIIFMVIFGGISIAKTANLWQSECSKKSPGKYANEIEHRVFSITGNTTVQEAIGNGIPLNKIEAVLGTKIKNNNMRIRDIAKQQNKPFDTVKEYLNSLIKN